MAVAAELHRHTQTDTYQLVDAIPEVADARDHERAQAEALLESRRSNVGRQLAGAEVLLPIDALSTAHKVLEAENTYGRGSAVHGERYKGLVLDCQRLVGEWYRKKKPEYFAPVRHIFDAETQEFFSHGLSVRQMTENALTPIADNPEEEARRINERVEDATPQILRTLGHVAIGDAAIRTISECSDKAITDYAYDMENGRPHRGYGGYVPEIEKVMIRDIRLDVATNDRFEVQIGMPGTYISHYIIQKTLQRMGADVAHLDKTGLHGAQLLARDDLLDFARELDATASAEWCTNIFMGEEVEAGYEKDYAAFRREALGRQESLTYMAEVVATYILDLAGDNVDRRQAPSMVEEFVKQRLLELGKKDIHAAEQMFDTRTAKGLQEVAYLESIGQYERAGERMRVVEKEAPGGGYCGASCGVETVNPMSAEGRALAKKLGAKPGDTLSKDKVRKCRCGSKKVAYAYNNEKVIKRCDDCGESESRYSKVA